MTSGRMTNRPCALEAPDEIEVVADGQVAEAARLLVGVAPAEESLVAEGQPQQARAQVRPPRDAPHRPSAGSYASEKAPPAAPPAISRRMIASASFGGRESAWTKKKMSPRARPAAAARLAPRVPADASAITASQSGPAASSRSSAISAGDSSSTGTIREIMRRPDASIRRHADSDSGGRARGRRVAADGTVESRAAVRLGDPSRVPDRAARPDLRGGLRRREGAAVVRRGTGGHPAGRSAGSRRDPRPGPCDRGVDRPCLRAGSGPPGPSRGPDPGDRPPRDRLARRGGRARARTAGSSLSPRYGAARPCRPPQRISRRESSRCTRSSRRSEPRSSRRTNGGRSIPPETLS